MPFSIRFYLVFKSKKENVWETNSQIKWLRDTGADFKENFFKKYA